MKNKFLVVLPLLFITQFSQAQELLTLKDAVSQALENNYNIRLVKKQVEIAKNNNTYGNAGFFPNVILQGGDENSSSNVYQKYYDGRIKDQKGANANSLTGSILLNWTIFQGFDMFIAKNGLNAQEDFQQLQAQMTVENTVASVISLYYGIVAEKLKANVMKNALALSGQRKKLSVYKLRLGMASKTDLYQSEVDYNADTAAYIQQKNTLLSMKTSLNTLLARSLDTDFKVADTLIISSELQLANVLDSVNAQNTQLSLARLNTDIAGLNLKYWKNQYYPAISIYGGYNYVKSTSQAGLLESNRNYGPVIGVSGSMTLFNGLANSRNIKNAQIQVQASKLEQEKTHLEMEDLVYRQYLNYATNVNLAKLEKNNLSSAKGNLDIAIEKFKLGAIDNLQLRDIQVKYIQAQNRFYQAIYQVKVGETELLRLSGNLNQI